MDFPIGTWETDVILADGGSAQLRPVRPEDATSLQRLYESLSDESRYRRFFSPATPAIAGALGPRVDIDNRHFGLVAETREEIVGVADYYRTVDDVAEVAFTVSDDQQGRGVGTLLLDHLAEVATARGIRYFVAQVMARNQPMRGVFSDAGFEVTWSRMEIGIIEVTLDLARDERWLDAHAAREHTAEARSVAQLLSPRSIAVVGASRRPDAIGHAILQNLLTGRFDGPVYPVNPNVDSIEGLDTHPSVEDIPGPVDLAVVAVPAEAVEAVVRQCAEKGARGLILISSGFAELGEQDAQEALVHVARRNGMRVVGPNCVGVVNTNPSVSMNATFAPVTPIRGRVGFASQSGGIGIELLARARALDLGVSTFVSLGNKADVSSNDLLQYWEHDPDTDVVLLYLESFGNPRKFARLARRIARTKPILALKSGRTLAGARGAASHTAALANPDVAVDELFRQAGVVRVDTLEQLFDTANLFVHQPLPAGRRVAIVSNGGGPGILAADACIAAGLEVPELSDVLQAAIRALAPRGAGVRNPVDLVAAAGADVYRQALEAILGSGEVDALLVIYVSPLISRPEDIEQSVVRAAQLFDTIPTAACFLGADRPPGPLRGGDAASRPVPALSYPESAANALARGAQLAEWRNTPAITAPVFADLDTEGARSIVRNWLANEPAGGWLDAITASRLLASYGVRVVTTRHAATADEAITAAGEVGYPVALKAGAPDLVHKTDIGGVRLGLESDDAVREAFDAMRATLGDRMDDALVQPMAAPGIELIVGITHDQLFGPLVLLGMGGIAAELTRDTALRIVPVSVLDAHQMVRSLRSSPLLFGYRNTAEVDVAAVEDVLLRIGQLAEEIPELAELDCNPLVASPAGALVLDVKVRLEPRAAPSGFNIDL
jgi:acetyl coenzyme A synthetase (ADP forming)-like protein